MCGGIFKSIGHGVSSAFKGIGNVVGNVISNPIVKTVGEIGATVAGHPEIAALIEGGSDLANGQGIGRSALGAIKSYGLSQLGNQFIGSPTQTINWNGGGSSVVGGSGLLGSLTSSGGSVTDNLSRLLSGTSLSDGASGAVRSMGDALLSGGQKMGDALISGIKSGAGSMFSLPTSLLNVGGNIFSAIQSNDAYKKMMEQEQGALSKQLAALAPYQQGGAAAQGQLAKLLGLSPDSDAGTIQSTLEGMPGYQFQLQQGQKALNNSLASRGMMNSGAAVKEAQQFGQGLANQTYNDYVSQLLQQSGQGQAATLGAAGAQANMGDTMAGLTAGKTGALNNSLAQILKSLQGNNSKIIWNS